MKLLKFLKFWRLPKKIWVTALLILISAGIYYYYPKQKPEEIKLVEVKTGQVKEIISSSGTLEGTDSADLRFKIGGKLNYLAVKPGEKVKQGSLIASIDTRDLQIDLQQARNTFEIKDAAAKRAEDDVKDHISDENFTQRESRVAAQKARDNAFDEIKAAQRALEDAYIYAPILGIVTRADPNVGQIVSITDIIARIVDESEYVFEAEVDESDLGRIKLGQSAEVILNSYPDQVFNATVSEVRPTTETTDSGATVIIVKLALGKPEINFISGLNGQADIVLNEASNALIIPVEALMDNDEVYIKKGNSYEKIKPELGLRSDTDVEVKSGLSAGDLVVTNPDAVEIPNDKGFKFPWQ